MPLRKLSQGNPSICLDSSACPNATPFLFLLTELCRQTDVGRLRAELLIEQTACLPPAKADQLITALAPNVHEIP